MNSKRLINAEYTNKYYSKEKDNELEEINKKIEYYSDEIKKKNFQIDNILGVNKITDLKNKLKEENDKINDLNKEKISLVNIYNNQVKEINNISMKFDIANEDKAIEKIQSMKLELKELEKKSREYEEKLKEQRLTYSNLNSTINKIKERINLIKGDGPLGKDNKNKIINYEEEIIKLNNEIREEEELYKKEENDYKTIVIDNEKEIKRLTEEIMKKQELLQNKGNQIRKDELIKKIEKRKKINIPLNSYENDNLIEKNNNINNNNNNENNNDNNNNNDIFFITEGEKNNNLKEKESSDEGEKDIDQHEIIEEDIKLNNDTEKTKKIPKIEEMTITDINNLIIDDNSEENNNP